MADAATRRTLRSSLDLSQHINGSFTSQGSLATACMLQESENRQKTDMISQRSDTPREGNNNAELSTYNRVHNYTDEILC